MNEASRRVYLGLGRAFVAVGGGVALGSVLDRMAGWGFFSGSPVGTALFLVAIGALLLWTVRQADARPEREAEPAPEHETELETESEPEFDREFDDGVRERP
jgi:hypothetical protein